MPAPRNRKHLLVPDPPSSEAYTPHPRKFEQPPIAGPPNRRRHARALRDALLTAEREARQARDALDISVHGAEPGLYNPVRESSRGRAEARLVRRSQTKNRTSCSSAENQWP